MLPERVKQAFRLGEIEGRLDPLVLGPALALAGIGLVMVMSSSVGVTERLHVGTFYFFARHAVFLGMGVVLAALVTRVELRQIERHGQSFLIVAVVLLLAVLIPGIGSEVNGARRWLSFGGPKFQAVEAVKVLLIVWLASYLVRHRQEVQSSVWGLIKPLFAAALMIMLLMAQPDFGSSVLIAAIVGGMLFLGGAPLRSLIAPAVLGGAALALIAVLEPYRLRRLTSFVDPWADPFDKGFQLTQALIAIGRGEWFGVGIGASIQKLSFLPEAHTDFIFSVIAEETGFIGVSVIIALFAILVGRAFWLGLQAIYLKRPFAGYCAFGVALWIGLQASVSIGVNLGLLPTKGLTLPLVSYGGSSVLMTCVALGLLLRVGCEVDRTERQITRIRDGAVDVRPPGDGILPSFDAAATQTPRAVNVPSARQPVRSTPTRAAGRIEPSLGGNA
jgi:cell division protein FtsW